MNLPYQTQLTAKTVEENNKIFYSLSTEDQKKEIALDALFLFHKKTLIPYSSGYMNFSLRQKFSSSSKETQENLLNIKKKDECAVCMRGGIIVAMIRKGNRFSSTTAKYTSGDPLNLIGISYDEMRVMEGVYEDWDTGLEYRENTKLKSYTSAIMKNMCLNILHNEKFDVKDYTNYLHLLK